MPTYLLNVLYEVAARQTGTRRDGRAEIGILLQLLRAGDMLVVTCIDRLARSLEDLQDIVHELKEKGVTLKVTDQPVDTATTAGKAFSGILGVFAEFETSRRRERQMEGIAAAKVRGVYKGRKPKIDPDEVRRHAEQSSALPPLPNRSAPSHARQAWRRIRCRRYVWLDAACSKSSMGGIRMVSRTVTRICGARNSFEAGAFLSQCSNATAAAKMSESSRGSPSRSVATTVSVEQP